MNNARRLVYMFYKLPYHVRLEVAQQLNLTEGGDNILERNDKYRMYFKRAREKQLLEKLWEFVCQRNGIYEEGNPFSGH